MRTRLDTPARSRLLFGVALAGLMLGIGTFAQQGAAPAAGARRAPAAPAETMAAPEVSSPAAEVMAAEVKLDQAVMKGDLAYFDKAVSPDMMFNHLTHWATGGKPTVDDYTSFRKRLVDKVYIVRDVDTMVQKAEMHGDIAITYGRYVNLGRPKPDALPGTLSSIWYERVYQKRNGQWIFLSHRTVHGPNPAPAANDPTLAEADPVIYMLTDPAPPVAAAKSADEAEILAMDQKVGTAMTKGDSAYVASVTPADFVMVHGDAWTRGQKPLATDTQESMLKRATSTAYDVLDFSPVRTEMHGDVAITYGRYLAHTTGGGAPDRSWFSVWFERVYAKRDGKWNYLSHRTVHGPTYGADRKAVSDK